MGRRTVDLVEYSPDWPVLFERERAALARAVGDIALVIEHIGSTAVPGLVAKPTIDIALGVESIAALRAHERALEGLGYEWRTGMHDRHQFLRKIAGDERTHHLHAIECPSDEFDDWILFRDLLRRDATARELYVTEKRRLAERFYTDRGAYVEGKSVVVGRLVAQARKEAGRPRS